MKTIEIICRQLGRGEFDFSQHASKRSVVRNISNREIREAGANAQRIEDYPTDKYAPSCLLLGYTKNGRVLHIQVSYADTANVKIIALYEPDPDEWDETFSIRRSKE
ncbi:MAG TPA: DUF4258 domain-containing protein [Anaerolineae bacterium]|nr:DUF4258 domain-containing protein [Anaerolineae bacterium]